MKLLIVIAILAGMALAQRPSYAGTREVGLPDLANRFRDDNDQPQLTDNRFGNNRGSNNGLPFWYPNSRRSGVNNRNNRLEPADVGTRFSGSDFDINAEIDDFGNPIPRGNRNSGRLRLGFGP